jgi:hypothetical protein
MSYATINQAANDAALCGRIMAAIAAEGEAYPVEKYGALVWPVCSAADVAAAYESAVLADNPDPGGDPAVVTDQMILSAVQAHWPAE